MYFVCIPVELNVCVYTCIHVAVKCLRECVYLLWCTCMPVLMCTYTFTYVYTCCGVRVYKVWRRCVPNVMCVYSCCVVHVLMLLCTYIPVCLLRGAWIPVEACVCSCTSWYVCLAGVHWDLLLCACIRV